MNGVFDATIHKGNAWIKELSEQFHWENDHRSYQALRAVLYALGDRLTIAAPPPLGAQLPMLTRGLYYEGWDPSRVPRRERSREEFLAHVRRELLRG